MRRPTDLLATAILVPLLGLGATATVTAATAPTIYLNDAHTGIVPAKLHGTRVLGAIVRRGNVLIPAAAAFRAMNAATTYDPGSKTLRVSAAGHEIVLVAGRASATIDGSDRPLDVAPELDGGVFFAPIRVVAESLGAYVQWVPDRRIVVIRYLALAPVPSPSPAPSLPPPGPRSTPAPVASPPVPASPSPSPAPRRKTYDRFVAVDAQIATRIANEFVPNLTSRTTANVRLGVEYKFLRGRSFAEAQYRRFDVVHPDGFVTPIGGSGSAFVPQTRLTDEQFEFHTSIYGGGHAYLAMSTIQVRNHFGYPRLGATYGFGAELLPQLERPVGLEASYFYYPELAGTYTPPGAPEYRLRYKLQTYTLGAHAALGHSPAFAELGFYGDHYLTKQNAPGPAEHASAEFGLGLHF